MREWPREGGSSEGRELVSGGSGRKKIKKERGTGLYVWFWPRLGTVSSGLGEGEEKVWFFSLAEG